MTGIDPATLAVLQNALRQIVDEMDVTLERAAFNQVLSEARDRANGIYHHATGEVVAQGDTGLPIFVGVMQHAVQSAIAAFPDLEEGDVVLLNDPYCGGTHLMDMKLVRPFFYRGRRFAFLANCGHWTDVGGNVPGGFGVRATEVIQEGMRIPPVLICRKGEVQEDLLTILFANMRVPEERRGDLQAQFAALNVGDDRLRRLLDKYGDDTIHRYTDELGRRSEQQMRSFIGEMPDGVYRFESFLDSDGIDFRPIRVAVEMTVAGDRLRFDFSDSAPPVTGPLNGTLAGTVSSVLVAIKHAFPEVPINAGCFRPIEIVVPETTFLNARFPRPVSGSSVEVSMRVFDAVCGCLAQAIPDRVPAACFGTGANFTLSGTDPLRDQPYIMFRFSGGGYGGHPLGDGLTNGNTPISVARTSPLEVIEQLYPVRFDFYRLRERSAGPGRHRGGFGTEYQIRVTRGEARSSVLAERGVFAPYGLAGGGEAGLTVIEYRLGGRTYRPEHVTKDESVPMQEGDTALVSIPGGGGLGDPFAREPERVLRDVAMEYITPEDARIQYGVAMVRGGAGWTVDPAETVALRRAR